MPAKSHSVQKASTGAKPRKAVRASRAKLSTTVAAENFAFLERCVSTGRTHSIAEAVDLAIARLRRAENRRRLERATAAYFEGLTPEAEAEEDRLALQLHAGAGAIDFDLEP